MSASYGCLAVHAHTPEMKEKAIPWWFCIVRNLNHTLATRFARNERDARQILQLDSRIEVVGAQQYRPDSPKCGQRTPPLIDARLSIPSKNGRGVKHFGTECMFSLLIRPAMVRKRRGLTSHEVQGQRKKYPTPQVVMVEFSLVRISKAVFQALVAARKFDSTVGASWDAQHFDSLEAAAQTSRGNYCTVVLFNFAGATDQLKSEIASFQRAAPGTPVAAVLSGRKFDSEEIHFLNSANVRTCIDSEALADPARLHRILCVLTEQLAPSIVLQMLRPHLSTAAVDAARLCLRMLATNPAAFASPAYRTALLDQIRLQSHGYIAHAENFCILLQHLYGAVLMKLTLQPLSGVSDASGFPTPDAARHSLFRKTRVTARQAHDKPAKLNEVIHLLIQLLKVSTEGETLTTGQQDNRTTGQQDNRTTGITDYSVFAIPSGCTLPTPPRSFKGVPQLRSTKDRKLNRPWGTVPDEGQAVEPFGGRHSVVSVQLQAQIPSPSVSLPPSDLAIKSISRAGADQLLYPRLPLNPPDIPGDHLRLLLIHSWNCRHRTKAPMVRCNPALNRHEKCNVAMMTGFVDLVNERRTLGGSRALGSVT